MDPVLGGSRGHTLRLYPVLSVPYSHGLFPVCLPEEVRYSLFPDHHPSTVGPTLHLRPLLP